MNFYTSFLLFNIFMSACSKNISTKSGLLEVVPNSVGLRFFTEINNTSGEECAVEVHADECCLHAGDARCDVLHVIGSAADIIPEGTTKTLHMIAPLLDPYNRKGFCTIYVDYKSSMKPDKFIRDTIRIKFDTTLEESHATDDVRICKHVDEDPLNDCKPVSCDVYYNGKKSYFNVIKKRCVEVPTCLTKLTSDTPPRSAYNPVSNKCVTEPAIGKGDIDFIKALTQGKGRKAKDIMIINTVTRNGSPVSPKEAPAASRDPATNATKRLHAVANSTKRPKLAPRFTCFCTYIAMNKNMLMALGAVILLQCCLICTMVYCLTKHCACCKKKKVINKFFNYRQDASVTTPLIGTSNMDTETTDYQYLSESSNYIDKKIKCYKACQKERKTSVKLSMSDDILSKCITRRDWQRLPRPETIPEVRADKDLRARDDKEVPAEPKSFTGTKVNFQEEKRDKKPRPADKSDSKSNAGTLSDSSEKVIRCHSYDYDGGSNVAGFRQTSNCKQYGVYKQEKLAESSEQAAQAYFSNDSIDDFLSERGVLFIGDNASRYSFSSLSSAANSSASSKTSKNNAIRDVIPFLCRKSKGPSSDPGLKKSKPDLDLELLHISRVSMCSSSNDSDLGKDLKKIKESTSSL